MVSFQTDAPTNSQHLISADGRLKGKCSSWLWNKGRNWVTIDGRLLFTRLNDKTDHYEIVLGDPDNCDLETLYIGPAKSDGAYLDEAHLSLQGNLIFGQVHWQTGQTEPATADLVLVDQQNGETTVIAHGRAPMWSKDGQWIAFTKLDGLYIIRPDGSEERRIVEIDSRSASYPNTSPGDGWYSGFPAPSWSPDGEWLVYHRMTEFGPVIYKANVETGEEIKLFEGGTYPNWRWDRAAR